MNVEIRRNGQLEHLIYARPPMIEGLLIDSSTQSTGQSAFMGLEAKQAGRSDISSAYSSDSFTATSPENSCLKRTAVCSLMIKITRFLLEARTW